MGQKRYIIHRKESRQAAGKGRKGIIEPLRVAALQRVEATEEIKKQYAAGPSLQILHWLEPSPQVFQLTKILPTLIG